MNFYNGVNHVMYFLDGIMKNSEHMFCCVRICVYVCVYAVVVVIVVAAVVFDVLEYLGRIYGSLKQHTRFMTTVQIVNIQ